MPNLGSAPILAGTVAGSTGRSEYGGQLLYSYTSTDTGSTPNVVNSVAAKPVRIHAEPKSARDATRAITPMVAATA